MRPDPRIILVAVLLASPCFGLDSTVANVDGVIMQGSRVMLMKRGKATQPMTSAMTMSNGATVMPDGTVRLSGGNRLRLENGQMMTMDGAIMQGGKPKPMMKPRGIDSDE